jgi:hypothetical protein
MNITNIIEEIKLIPEDKISELYDFIHFYRLGLETVREDTADIMRFAGCWEDMPEEEFQDFLEEIEERRQQTFSRRREYEAFLD